MGAESDKKSLDIHTNERLRREIQNAEKRRVQRVREIEFEQMKSQT